MDVIRDLIDTFGNAGGIAAIVGTVVIFGIIILALSD